ncbi:hypothetical protein [Pseudothermotoga sp.]|uniref:hypothetical protein n=1 Tax=Pseudothermotoga sp. TaxID=2033661 RepID=UPI0031F5FBDD
MERINLFRYKRPILKISSFIVFTAALLSPVLAMRFTLEFYKRSAINSIQLNHSKIVEKYKLNLVDTPLPSLLSALDKISNQLVQTSKHLQNQIDYLESHIKNHNEKMEPLIKVLSSLQKSDQNWIVLRQFEYDDSVKVELYELYEPYVSRKADLLEKVLMELGYKVSKNVTYDASMRFLNKKISNVIIEGRK